MNMHFIFRLAKRKLREKHRSLHDIVLLRNLQRRSTSTCSALTKRRREDSSRSATKRRRIDDEHQLAGAMWKLSLTT